VDIMRAPKLLNCISSCVNSKCCQTWCNARVRFRDYPSDIRAKSFFKKKYTITEGLGTLAKLVDASPIYAAR